jgi:mannose-6-phosphate isomerase-like protein (cupin superfamily)
MELRTVNLREKLAKFDELWSPRIIAQMNDLHLKLAKIEGEFVRHTHSETDEVFLVLRGAMRIEFEGLDLDLEQGELCVVPRGVAHRPVADKVCEIMLIEPAGTVNTGDAGGEQTLSEDIWI